MLDLLNTVNVEGHQVRWGSIGTGRLTLHVRQRESELAVISSYLHRAWLNDHLEFEP